MGSFDIEICYNCGREIARSEQAYVFEGKIVCAKCDNALRSVSVAETSEPPDAPEPITTVEPQFEEPDLSRPDEQEKANQGQYADKPVGFIIAGVILCILGIFLIALGLLGLVVSFLGGILIGILLAGWFLILGIIIIISGIAAIVIGVISRQHPPH